MERISKTMEATNLDFILFSAGYSMLGHKAGVERNALLSVSKVLALSRRVISDAFAEANTFAPKKGERKGKRPGFPQLPEVLLLHLVELQHLFAMVVLHKLLYLPGRIDGDKFSTHWTVNVAALNEEEFFCIHKFS